MEYSLTNQLFRKLKPLFTYPERRVWHRVKFNMDVSQACVLVGARISQSPQPVPQKKKTSKWLATFFFLCNGQVLFQGWIIQWPGVWAIIFVPDLARRQDNVDASLEGDIAQATHQSSHFKMSDRDHKTGRRKRCYPIRIVSVSLRLRREKKNCF